MVTSPFLKDLQDRGFINQCTDLEELDKLANAEPLTLYIGFDMTAESLHVGNLVQVMALRRAQQHGHKPIILLGSATTKIGDPTGKNEMRKMLDDEKIEHNKNHIKSIYEKYLICGEGKTDAIFVDNDDWLKEVGYLNFLRDYGKYFSINRMLTFDIVKSRLDNDLPLSFLEFNYMILQAYDFMELNKRYNCSLQLGGGDQWVNIINGVDLIRRVNQKPSFGLTTPLITTASGAKMGKTAAGAVWLNGDMLSPFEYWQFWRNTEDADVCRFLKLFTDLPVEEINKYESLEGAEINEVKTLLADEATKLAHGEDVLSGIKETAKGLFSNTTNLEVKVVGEENGVPVLESAVPIVQISTDEFGSGKPAFELLKLSGLVASNGEARRLIQGKGGKINDVVIEDPNALITSKDLKEHNVLKVSAGKKKHAFLQII